MKYTFPYGDRTKTVDISDEWIKKTKINLNLSTSEAISLWLCDNGYENNPIADALTAKAKAVGTNHDTGNTPRKPRERKPDDIKRALIAGLQEYVSAYEGTANVEVTNIERMISFSIGDDKYELTLSKKRKPKN